MVRVRGTPHTTEPAIALGQEMAEMIRRNKGMSTANVTTKHTGLCGSG
jgi:hypothetical protein